MTRVHHPLRGEKLVLWQGAGDHITVVLKDGSRMKLPRQWTDIDGPGTDHSFSSIFTADSIKELIDLIDLFLER